MVIDSSIIIALLLGEPEAERIALAISTDSNRTMAAVSLLETAIVIESKKGPVGVQALDALMYQTGIEVIGMNTEQVTLARHAYSKYGKGRHEAGLNLGDCCSYALAKYSEQPLMFKGNDFSKTDIKIVDY